MTLWRTIADWVERDGAAALVSVVNVKGSAPRGTDARIAVRSGGGFVGTIGGGALEFEMLRAASGMLLAGPAGRMIRQTLGPDLGQCCGGQADIRIETFAAADLSWILPLAEAEAPGSFDTVGRVDHAGRLIRAIRDGGADTGDAIIEQFGDAPTRVMLFGAGHVGRALVLALAPLPFQIDWIDGRDDVFPPHVPGHVRLAPHGDPLAALRDCPAGALVVVMTHSHALDLAIVQAALTNPEIPYVGLIGSATKRARFTARLRQAGCNADALARLVSPIGGRRLADKSPPVIAAAIAVELLEMRETLSSARRA